jgi:LytS/YehU family sensor histidine kinase
MSHAEIAPSSVPQSTSLISRTALIVAAVFGVAALLVVIAGLHVPIPGTEVVTDPRELFTTLGSGLTGPVGALLIGILAGIMEPGGLAPAS